jgi:hypothetical protein
LPILSSSMTHGLKALSTYTINSLSVGGSVKARFRSRF